MVLSFFSICAFAQGGGVKGKVVSRTGRMPIDGVNVTLTPGAFTTTTNVNGLFVFSFVESLKYILTF